MIPKVPELQRLLRRRELKKPHKIHIQRTLIRCKNLCPPMSRLLFEHGQVYVDNSEDPTLVIPSGKTFLLKCAAFSGPCNSDSIHIQLLRGITAPKSINGWQGCDTKGYLIQELTIDGPGHIDGQGSIWWGGSKGSYKPTGPTCDCPSMIHFHKCDGLQLRDTPYMNSRPESDALLYAAVFEESCVLLSL